MPPLPNGTGAFRFLLVLLLAAAIGSLLWECVHRPPQPSRVDWPAKTRP